MASQADATREVEPTVSDVQRKVCLRLAEVIETACGHRFIVPPGVRRLTVDCSAAFWTEFVMLPRQAQCDRCVYWAQRHVFMSLTYERP